MKEYGIIQDGYLTSRLLEPYVEKYRDDNNELRERIVTIEQQEENCINNGWKPVVAVDETKLVCDENYVVRIYPYDAGDCILYAYEPIFDTHKIKLEIQCIKDELANDDYKITKCYEASLIGESLPYDIQSLHLERQNLRTKINELEALLNF